MPPQHHPGNLGKFLGKGLQEGFKKPNTAGTFGEIPRRSFLAWYRPP
jgi:hypothetical protein